MNIVKIDRLVFFICSSIIIGLLIAWGVEGFSLLTETKSSVHFEDKVTGMIYTETQKKFSMGLDLVALLSLAVAGLGFVVIKLINVRYKNKA